MKRASLRILPLALGVLFLASCNGSSSGNSVLGNLPGPNNPPTFTRLFDAQEANGLVYIIPPPFAAPLTPSGSFSKTSSSFGSIAFNPTDGTLAVSNFNAPNVTIFHPPYSGTTMPSVTIGGGATTLNGPIGVAFDGSGNLWVADFGDGKIKEFTPPFGASNAPAATNTVGGRPWGVAINPVAGLMFVGNQAGNVVVIPAPYTGVPTATLSTPVGTQPVAVDLRGRLFVGFGGGSKNGKIDVYTPPYATGNNPAFELTGPPLVSNLALDSAQNLYDQVDDGSVALYNGPILGPIGAPSALLGCPTGVCHFWAGIALGP